MVACRFLKMIAPETDKADAGLRTRIEKEPQRAPFDTASLGLESSAEINLLPALFSVVIPVYNSAAIVAETVSQVRAFFLSQGYRYEIILVNDGSEDGSWNVVSGLARKFSGVVGINLLKNYGQHNANLCGFRESKGDYVITMDDDLQNPPAEIGKLIEAARQGHDLVVGRFESKQHRFIRRLGSRVVGWLNRRAF
ncbi:MAG TPA: glycosyltransferase family 2 protein, partial [Verrucomicrobiae bacterium]|nr:glycosyltransferase family 2 protein [Verrucomicrobiae bacterium]